MAADLSVTHTYYTAMYSSSSSLSSSSAPPLLLLLLLLIRRRQQCTDVQSSSRSVRAASVEVAQHNLFTSNTIGRSVGVKVELRIDIYVCVCVHSK